MATILNFANFDFTAEQIRAVNELVFDEIIESPEISMLCTLYPGIVYDKEIGFIGKGGLVGVAKQGCDPTPQDWSINTRMVKWTPKSWEILISQCAEDLEATAAIYSLKTGVDVDDFTSSDYMNIIIEVLGNAIKEFIIRLIWFNDTEAKNVSAGGEITNGIAAKYFNILDGFWKQMETQVTIKPAQLVSIAENAASTAATQTLTPSIVRDTYLKKLVFGADVRLRGKSNGTIYCTQSFYDAYALSLMGVNLESLYANLVNGQKTLTYNGVPLLPIPIWDSIIAQYYNTGTKLINPHRAVYTIKDVLAVGVDGKSSFGDLDTWYNKDSRKVKIESKGRADAKILNPEMFQLAI